MMVRKTTARLALALCCAIPAAAVYAADASHVGLISGAVNQGEDEVRGAEAMSKEYGDVTTGGMNSSTGPRTTSPPNRKRRSCRSAALINDPLMKHAETQRLQKMSVEMVNRVKKHRPLPVLKVTMKVAGIDCAPARLPLVAMTDGEITEREAVLGETGFLEWISKPAQS